MIDLALCKQRLPMPGLLHSLGLGQHAVKSARCPWPQAHKHGDRNPSFGIFRNGNGWAWKCFICGSGDEVTFLERHFGLSTKDAIAKYGELAGVNRQETGTGIGAASRQRGSERKEVCGYEYHDETGKVLFQVVRYEPKDFCQRRPDGKGGWIWNLKGVRRVLYRLHTLAGASKVWLCEGEKDADNLAVLGFTATTNPHGAGNWRSEYSETLRGKDILIVPDNDAPGRDHAEQVAGALQGIAGSVKLVALPEVENGHPVKDVSDFIATFADKGKAAERLTIMAEGATGHRPAQAELTPGGTRGNVESDSTNSTIPQGVRADQLVVPELYYPAGSVIERFVDYCTAQIETPKHFIVAGVLTLLSILLNRRVHYRWGGKRIFPNLFQVCVGNSGVIRKSDGLVIVREFVHELCPEVLLADFTSHERFVECFAEKPVRAMIYSEGKNLIDLLNCKYGAALAGDMIRLYDCEPISSDFKGDKHKTEDGNTGTRVVAKDTFLTVLLGIIPDGWKMPEGNQVNGLMGRFELLYADKREHDILTEPPVLTEEREQLLKDFRLLMGLEGRMRLSEQAQKAWLSIQKENRKRLNENPSNQIASNLSRMPFTTLRVAMLYQIAMSGGLEISTDALELAYNYVDFCHRCYLFFSGEMQKTNFARLQERMVEVLRRNGGHCTYSHLFNRVSTHGECYAKTFRDALESLEGRGLVARPQNQNAKNPDVLLLDEGSHGTGTAAA